MEKSPDNSIESLMAAATELHAQGSLAEASALYRKALEQDAEHAEAQHLLGLAAHQSGDSATGAALMEKSIRLDANQASYHANYGAALKALGRLEDAARAYERGMALDPGFLPAFYNAGQVYCLLERFEDAERVLRRAAELNPQLPAIWYNLGLCCSQMDNWEAAAESYQEAIGANPSYGDAYFGLGRAYAELGRLDEANNVLRSAMSLGYPERDCRLDLAGIAQRQGRDEEGVEHLERLVALGAADEAVYNNLALALQGLGRVEEADRAVDRALALDPDCVEALCTKASLRVDAGRFEEAEALSRRATEQAPHLDIAWNNLGTALRGMARLQESVEAYREAVRLKPDRPETRNNLGLALQRLGDAAGMEDQFKQALALRPNYASCYSNYSTGLIEAGRISEAEGLLLKALEIDEDLHAAWGNLGRVRYELGDFEESRQAYANAIAGGQSEGEMKVALAATQVANDAIDEETLYRYHREAGEILEAKRPAREASFAERIERERSSGKLRLGFVSSDFRGHSVAFFLMTLFQRLDRSRFEVYCYSGVQRPDGTTERFQALADGWRNILDTPTETIDRYVSEDGISVLIDLSGYTKGNCLGLFAVRAAPVQATWLGYAHSTGLSQMDYRLVDEKTDPEGVTLNSETLAYLPGSFLCYQVPENAPEPAAPPSLETGWISFGSFNNLVKLSPTSVELFAATLRAVEGSRLLLKSHQMVDRSIKERVLARFEAQGIGPERIELLPRMKTLSEHLDSYRRVDVALDTFPYHGTTTTCEALAMGVPVVTLAGRRHAARVGCSLLESVGLGDCVAQTREQFVAAAKALSEDLGRRSELRSGLRQRLLDSPLGDADRFARNFELAIEGMWARFLESDSR